VFGSHGAENIFGSGGDFRLTLPSIGNLDPRRLLRCLHFKYLFWYTGSAPNVIALNTLVPVQISDIVVEEDSFFVSERNLHAKDSK
jgi:hypothetical protein